MTCIEAIEIATWTGPWLLFMTEFGLVAGFILGRIKPSGLEPKP